MSLPRKSANILLLLLLATSLLINISQAIYIKRQIAYYAGAADQKTGLKIGDRVPPLQATDSSGKQTVISFDKAEKPTLVYVFSPSCMWCARNSGSLISLTDKVSGQYQVIGFSLSRSGLSGFVDTHGIRFPVYSQPSPPIALPYRFDVTPKTIVISPTGIVLGMWNGVYEGDTKDSLEQFFAIRL